MLVIINNIKIINNVEIAIRLQTLKQTIFNFFFTQYILNIFKKFKNEFTIYLHKLTTAKILSHKIFVQIKLQPSTHDLKYS